jgi:putative molybdopterin biosynthesis protein
VPDVSYTAEEIAKLLKVSRLTVYDLIKKGELPAYRVGKQMRVDAADLEAYKRKTKAGAADAADPRLPEHPAPIPAHLRAPATGSTRPLVITGQDISLDLLAHQMERRIPGIRPLRSHAGSLDSLMAMYRGQADIVSTHLWDGDTGEYNLPYIRKLLVGLPYLVVNLLVRRAGFIVQRGNPLGLSGWPDLARPGVRLVNREIGSGARVLLEEQLRLHRIAPAGIAGYDRIEHNHLGVAGAVASGEADVGIGIEKAASIVGNVDFIPLIEERYDLVMIHKPENRDWIDSVLAILESAEFRSEMAAIPGYDLSQTGRILFAPDHVPAR